MTTTKAPMSPMHAAAIQFDPRVGVEKKKANLAETLRLINKAADNRANLIVLPELCNTGYNFDTREEAYLHGESLPNGPTAQAWQDLARERNLYIVGGLVELDGVYLYNTAVLIGPDGFIGKYRKTHLWDREKLIFTPGIEGFPVFETKIGRIGMLICYDIWFPEVARILAVQGADVICSANNWIWTPPPMLDEAGNGMTTYLTMSTSNLNSVPIIAASRVGSERGSKYLGCSLITGVTGWPIGKVAGPEESTILYADLDIVASRSAMFWSDNNDIARDRRIDLYDPLLGYTGGTPQPR